MSNQIHDVAAYIIDHFDAPISTMKLQKLTFFSNGWSLAISDEPLFQDDFSAWKNGPVAYSLFHRHRGDFSVSEWKHGAPENLGRRERVVIDAVLQNYGALSGAELSELTHDPNGPWAQVRKERGIPEGGWASVVIPQDMIKAYFKRTLLGNLG